MTKVVYFNLKKINKKYLYYGGVTDTKKHVYFIKGQV